MPRLNASTITLILAIVAAALALGAAAAAYLRAVEIRWDLIGAGLFPSYIWHRRQITWQPKQIAFSPVFAAKHSPPRPNVYPRWATKNFHSMANGS